MIYNFDQIIDRRNTTCVKWDNDFEKDILQMWVADMDFTCPIEVQKAIEKRATHGVYGYTYPKDKVYDLIIKRLKEKFSWEIKKEWIVFLPGVVDGVASCTQAFTKKREAIVIQEPVYHPFKAVIKDNDRRVLNNPLKLDNKGYTMNLSDLERIIKEEKPKMLILCNPHNPVGRVWTQKELKELGDLCLKHNVLVISDEIHADIIYSGHRHNCFASLSNEFAENSVVLMAPSKTFNVAGLSQAFAIIPNEGLREIFKKSRAGMNWGNVFGITALEACYEYGEEYLKQLLRYLEGNVDFVKSFLDTRLPKVKMFRPEGTYLLWLDMRDLGMNSKELEEFLINKAGVRFNSGDMFGQAGQGFQRVNIGCSRAYIKEAMERIERAI